MPFDSISYSIIPFRDFYNTLKEKEKVPQNREQRRLKKRGKKF